MPKRTFFNLPEEKRSRIIDCAVEEFYQNGYRQASITRIVEAAGIAKGSFYQYFEDKADLYEHLISHLVVDRKMRIAAEQFSAKMLEDKPFLDIIRAVFEVQIREFLYDPKIMKIAGDFWRNRSGKVEQRILGKYEGVSGNYFSAVIRYSKRRGEMDPLVDEETLNFILTSMSQQTVARMEEGGMEALTREYFMDLLDKMQYILTNGIFRKTGV